MLVRAHHEKQSPFLPAQSRPFLISRLPDQSPRNLRRPEAICALDKPIRSVEGAVGTLEKASAHVSKQIDMIEEAIAAFEELAGML